MMTSRKKKEESFVVEDNPNYVAKVVFCFATGTLVAYTDCSYQQFKIKVTDDNAYALMDFTVLQSDMDVVKPGDVITMRAPYAYKENMNSMFFCKMKRPSKRSKVDA